MWTLNFQLLRLQLDFKKIKAFCYRHHHGETEKMLGYKNVTAQDVFVWMFAPIYFKKTSFIERMAYGREMDDWNQRHELG